MGYAGALKKIGPIGPKGDNGADGNRWHGGIGLPSTDLGDNDDFYLNYQNGSVYQKQAGEWFWQTNIKGPKGENGKNGNNGKDGVTKVVSMGGLSSNGTPYIIAKTHKVTVASKDEENQFQLPTECVRFLIKARKMARVRIAYEPDHLLSENYLSIGLGGHYEDNQFYKNQTIYFSSDRDNTVIEIVTFIQA